MEYGYARVSTTAQDLSVQKEALINVGIEKSKIYSDKFTGIKTDRPEFNLLLEKLKPNDTLTITKLDRLARNTKEALSIIEKLLDNDVTINVLNIGKIENTSIGKLIYTILLSVAELERDMIIERTQEGKIYAKKNNPNYKEGRPKRKLSTRYLKAIELMQTNSISQTAIITGVSESTLKRIRKQYRYEVLNGIRKAKYDI